MSPTRIGPVRCVAIAWLVAVVPGLLLFAARVALGNAPPYPTGGVDWTFAAYSVLAAPAIEGALMLAVAWLLRRALPGREGFHVIVLAALFTLAHVPGGSVVQGIAVAWPLLVYASVVVAWLPRSAAVAFLVTAAVHALYNASFFAVATAALLAAR